VADYEGVDVDHGTDRLPFLDKRGVLYIAPMGTELPDLTVASDPPGSGSDTKFVTTWPMSWVKPKPYVPDDPDSAFTDPADCSARQDIGVQADRLDELRPVQMMATSRTALWDFGPEVVAGLQRLLRPARGLQQTRMMLGWESEDCRDRVITPQVFLDEYGLFHLEVLQPPRPPAPPRKWWERLLRRPVRLAPMPDPEPLFKVYRVGHAT
jgi:hypothetical protein